MLNCPLWRFLQDNPYNGVPSGPAGGTTEMSFVTFEFCDFYQSNWSNPPALSEWVCVCVCQCVCVRQRIKIKHHLPENHASVRVKMHPVRVSIPSFRSENSSVEKGYTVSCSLINPVCLCVCVSPVLPLSSDLMSTVPLSLSVRS